MENSTRQRIWVESWKFKSGQLFSSQPQCPYAQLVAPFTANIATASCSFHCKYHNSIKCCHCKTMIAFFTAPLTLQKENEKKFIRKAAFKELTEINNSKSKTKIFKYDTFLNQPYLKCPKFITSERKLLYSLRSRMHPARNNF